MPRCHTCMTRHPRVQRGVSPRVHQQTPPCLFPFSLSLPLLLPLLLPWMIFIIIVIPLEELKSFNGFFTENKELRVWRRRGFTSSIVERDWWIRSMAERHLLCSLCRLRLRFLRCPRTSFSHIFPGISGISCYERWGLRKLDKFFFFLTFSPHMDIVLQSLFRFGFGFGFGLNLYYTMGIPSHQITVRFKLITIPQFFIVKPSYFSTRITVFPTLFDEVGRPLKPQCVWI